jgi:DNA invertase Pin-like site-specific DNA recombinase
MKVGIYTRVSTDKQTVENQIHKLKEYSKIRGYKIVKIYKDVITGKDYNRPGLIDLKNDIKRGRVKAVLVYDLDRLGRTVLDLIQLVDFFHAHNCNFISYNNSIDTTTPYGRFIFTLNAAYAELERNRISDRTKTAYIRKKAHAEALGNKVKWGRKQKKLSDNEIDLIIKLRNEGKSWRITAKCINDYRLDYGKDKLSYSTIRRAYNSSNKTNKEK